MTTHRSLTTHFTPPADCTKQWYSVPTGTTSLNSIFPLYAQFHPGSSAATTCLPPGYEDPQWDLPLRRWSNAFIPGTGGCPVGYEKIMPRPDGECGTVTVTVTTTVTATASTSSGHSTTWSMIHTYTYTLHTLTTIKGPPLTTTASGFTTKSETHMHDTQPPWVDKGTMYCCPRGFTYNDCLRTNVNQAYCTQGATVSGRGVTFSPDPLTVMTSGTIQIIHYGNARASLLVLIKEDGPGNGASSNGGGGLSTRAKVGIYIGVCVSLAIVTIIAIILGNTWYRRRKKLHNSFPTPRRTPELDSKMVKVSELDNAAEIRQMGPHAEVSEMACVEVTGDEWAKMTPVELPVGRMETPVGEKGVSRVERDGTERPIIARKPVPVPKAPPPERGDAG